MRHRRKLITAAVLTAALGVCAPALAFWTTTSGSSTISASATSLVAVASPAASATDSTHAQVTWTDSSNPSGTTYSVTGGGTGCSGVSSSPCNVTGLTPGQSYTFSITPAIGSAPWTGPAATTTQITTPKVSAGLSLSAPGTGTANIAIPASAVTATLSSGTSPGGTIGFTVFAQSSAPTACASGGTPVGTAVAVSGNGAYNPSTSFTPTAAGNYWWYASYSGDSQNSATATTCGAGMAETVVSAATNKLVVTSSASSGASSSTPNLGPITIQRQGPTGTPLTSGALTVNLTSTSSHGSFGTSQFDSTPVTSVSIPNGQSSVTVFYGDTTTGTPTITASAATFTSGTQAETITAAPAGLGITFTSASDGTPVKSCDPIGISYSCTISGDGGGNSVVFTVQFLNSAGTPVVYSATQSSSISESGQNMGSVSIAANASGSSGTLTASHTGASTKNSTLTFGPYTLTLKVGS